MKHAPAEPTRRPGRACPICHLPRRMPSGRIELGSGLMTWRPRRRKLPYTPRTRLFLGLAGSLAFALLGLWQRSSGEPTWAVSFGASIFLYVIASYSYWRRTR